MADSANDELDVAQLCGNPVAPDWQRFTRPTAHLTSGMYVLSQRVDAERSVFRVSASATVSIDDDEYVHWVHESNPGLVFHAHDAGDRHLPLPKPAAVPGSTDDSSTCLPPCLAAGQLEPYEEQLSRRAESIVIRVDSSLREESVDGAFPDDDIPTQAAIDACCDLAAKLSLFLATHTELMLAAFPDEGGKVSLIIHSNTTQRRTSFVVDANGMCAQISRLDKSLQAKHDRITLPDARGARELAKWVTGG